MGQVGGNWNAGEELHEDLQRVVVEFSAREPLSSPRIKISSHRSIRTNLMEKRASGMTLILRVEAGIALLSISATAFEEGANRE